MRKVRLLRRVKPFHSQTYTSLCYLSLNLMRRVHLLQRVEPLCLQTSTSLATFRFTWRAGFTCYGGLSRFTRKLQLPFATFRLTWCAGFTCYVRFCLLLLGILRPILPFYARLVGWVCIIAANAHACRLCCPRKPPQITANLGSLYVQASCYMPSLYFNASNLGANFRISKYFCWLASTYFWSPSFWIFQGSTLGFTISWFLIF